MKMLMYKETKGYQNFIKGHLLLLDLILVKDMVICIVKYQYKVNYQNFIKGYLLLLDQVLVKD